MKKYMIKIFKISVNIFLIVIFLGIITGTSLYYGKKYPQSNIAKLIRKVQIITINYLHLAMWLEYDEWNIYKAVVNMSDLKNIEILEIKKLDLLKDNLTDVYDPIYYNEGFAYERCGFNKYDQSFCDNVFVPNVGKPFNRLNVDCKTSYPMSFTVKQKEYWLFEEFFCKKGLFLYTRNGNTFESVTQITNLNVFDPTPLVFNDIVYIFATDPKSGLMLWKLKKLETNKWFSELDKRSPISTNPNSNRFGGKIFEWKGKFYGPMMNNSESYGKSLGLFEINLTIENKKILTKITENLLPNLKAYKYHTFSIGNCKQNNTCEVLIDIATQKKQSFHNSKYQN